VVRAGSGDLGDGSPPVGSRGKAPVGSPGNKVPRRLMQNGKFVYNFFNVFMYKM